MNPIKKIVHTPPVPVPLAFVDKFKQNQPPNIQNKEPASLKSTPATTATGPTTGIWPPAGRTETETGDPAPCPARPLLRSPTSSLPPSLHFSLSLPFFELPMLLCFRNVVWYVRVLLLLLTLLGC